MGLVCALVKLIALRVGKAMDEVYELFDLDGES